MRLASRVVVRDRLAPDLDAEPLLHVARDIGRSVTRREPADYIFSLLVGEPDDPARPFGGLACGQVCRLRQSGGIVAHVSLLRVNRKMPREGFARLRPRHGGKAAGAGPHRVIRSVKGRRKIGAPHEKCQPVISDGHYSFLDFR